MIISRTPYRISFFGGGTDYPSWYQQHGGKILGAAIDKYCWLVLREPSPFGKPYKIVYSKTEEQDCIGEIEHPAVRETLMYMGAPEKMEIYHTSDLPARSGVGSSSAFIVGLTAALDLYSQEIEQKFGKECNCQSCQSDGPYQLMSPQDSAESAIWVERNILGETVGCQDQYLCAYGGFRAIEFPKVGPVVVGYDITRPGANGNNLEPLQQHLMLFYTGTQRTATDVASAYVDKLSTKYEMAMKCTLDLVDKGIEAVNEPHKFGQLLDDAWHLKRQLPGVTNPVIDELYDKAWHAGAWGGKVLGAGGGGFLLFCVPPEKHQSVRSALGGLKEVTFRFENEGTKSWQVP